MVNDWKEIEFRLWQVPRENTVGPFRAATGWEAALQLLRFGVHYDE